MRFWHPQLALGFSDLPEQTFESFVTSVANQPAVRHLRELACLPPPENITIDTQPEGLYLWGDPGSGVSHLLNAAAYVSYLNQTDAVYADLAQLISYGPACIDGLEAAQLVSLDHLEVLVDQPMEWSVRIYQLINDMRLKGHRLIFGAHRPPNGLELPLVDLTTRLQWYPAYYLSPLDDAGQFAYLQHRAAQRGLEMKDDVARYLLSRVSRDINQLNALLDHLDQASMQARRKLTIPFVRKIISHVAEDLESPLQAEPA